MRKTIVALVVGGLLAVSPGFAAEQSVQTRIDLNTVVSKRQAVDLLLAEALQIYKSPARISHAGFTAKMPSNMELVTERLLEAYRLEPYRTDLLISAANAQIYNGKIDRAVALFEQWQNRLPQLLRYAHHGRGLAALGCGEDLDYCAQIDSVNVVPLQVEPGILKAAVLD